MESFTGRVVEIIKSIPAGKVMTYGQIARIAGNPKSARQVVRILHSMSLKHQLPWHRVINAKGEIGIKNNEHSQMQKFLLQNEGIEVKSEKYIDLKQYQYHMDEWEYF